MNYAIIRNQFDLNKQVDAFEARMKAYQAESVELKRDLMYSKFVTDYSACVQDEQSEIAQYLERMLRMGVDSKEFKLTVNILRTRKCFEDAMQIVYEYALLNSDYYELTEEESETLLKYFTFKNPNRVIQEAINDYRSDVAKGWERGKKMTLLRTFFYTLNAQSTTDILIQVSPVILNQLMELLLVMVKYIDLKDRVLDIGGDCSEFRYAVVVGFIGCTAIVQNNLDLFKRLLEKEITYDILLTSAPWFKLCQYCDRRYEWFTAFKEKTIRNPDFVEFYAHNFPGWKAPAVLLEVKQEEESATVQNVTILPIKNEYDETEVKVKAEVKLEVKQEDGVGKEYEVSQASLVLAGVKQELMRDIKSELMQALKAELSAQLMDELMDASNKGRKRALEQDDENGDNHDDTKPSKRQSRA